MNEEEFDMSITSERALELATEHTAREREELGATVSLEPIEGGGWYVAIEPAPEHRGVLGLGSRYVTPDGRVLHYASHLSPDLADAAFVVDRDGGA